jgi:hypothetical protein
VRTRRPALIAATAGLTALGVTAAVGAAALPGTAGRSLEAPVPVVTSPNVSLVTSVLDSGTISMAFSPNEPLAYVSSLDTITVLDIKDPKAPKPLGSVTNVMFQNEAMSYGERTAADGTTQKFVLSAIDLYQVSPDKPAQRNLGGFELVVVDVTNPAKPFLRSRTRTKTSAHTARCVDVRQCDYAYTSGDGGQFTIVDLRDLDKPVQVGDVASPAAEVGGPQSGTGGFATGHFWDFENGLGWHTGGGGVALFDVRVPAEPVLLNGTTAEGRAVGWNDFILHNSQRPNGDVFLPGAEPSVFNGNVLLVGEEDYLDGGDELLCEEAGSFQTWHVPSLEGPEGYTGAVDTGSIAPLDRKNAADLGGGLTLPAAAFCSAHWFDYHQDGFVAHGFYQAGLRILDVKDAGEVEQVGWATTGATEVWDAYWVPEYDKTGRPTGQKTNIVYTADATRGLDVYQVDLPELTDAEKAAKAAMEQRRAAAQQQQQSGGEDAGPGAQGLARAEVAGAKGRAGR